MTDPQSMKRPDHHAADLRWLARQTQIAETEASRWRSRYHAAIRHAAADGLGRDTIAAVTLLDPDLIAEIIDTREESS